MKGKEEEEMRESQAALLSTSMTETKTGKEDRRSADFRRKTVTVW